MKWKTQLKKTINDKKPQHSALQNLTVLQGYFSHYESILFLNRLSNSQFHLFCQYLFFYPSTITAFSNGFHVKRAREMMVILTALLEQFHLVFPKLTGD